MKYLLWLLVLQVQAPVTTFEELLGLTRNDLTTLQRVEAAQPFVGRTTESLLGGVLNAWHAVEPRFGANVRIRLAGSPISRSVGHYVDVTCANVDYVFAVALEKHELVWVHGLLKSSSYSHIALHHCVIERMIP